MALATEPKRFVDNCSFRETELHLYSNINCYDYLLSITDFCYSYKKASIPHLFMLMLMCYHCQSTSELKHLGHLRNPAS